MSLSTSLLGHSRPDPRVIENVDEVLVVGVKKAHLHVVIEHGPGHRSIVVDDAPHLQQLLEGAVVETELAGVGGENHLRALDVKRLIHADAEQALWMESGLDLSRLGGAVARPNRCRELSTGHQRDDDVGGAHGFRHGQIEMIHPRLISATTFAITDGSAWRPGRFCAEPLTTKAPGPARRICGCAGRFGQIAIGPPAPS